MRRDSIEFQITEYIDKQQNVVSKDLTTLDHLTRNALRMKHCTLENIKIEVYKLSRRKTERKCFYRKITGGFRTSCNMKFKNHHIYCSQCGCEIVER